MIRVPHECYTVDPTTQSITLLSPHTNVTTGMISTIINMNTKVTLYDSQTHTTYDTKITMVGPTITCKVGTIRATTDKMLILYEKTGVYGGSA